MLDGFLKSIFLVGLVMASVIRVSYGRRHRRGEIAGHRREGVAVWSLMFAWGAVQILCVAYVFTSKLRFADYHLPPWAGLAGVTVYGAALWLLWRSHADLRRNWSPTLQIRQGHALVTHGAYRSIRHPMYAAHWLWVIAQALLIQNWIAGPTGLAVFLPLYLLRVPREERMMLDHFGEEYRSYMNRTERVIPRLE